MNDNTVVVAISIKKFHPTKPTIKKVIISPKEDPPDKSISIGLKNTKQHNAKMPVFIRGTSMLAITIPSAFLFSNNLKINPATKPAIVHFNKQAMTVPIGLYGINRASVDGENKIMMPLKKPSTAPDNGPYNTAAKTIATKAILILTGPNCK